MRKKKFYITTPLYYVNARAHIGHSYTNVVSDCIARYKRLQGYQVFFLTGTDEHGQKVAQAADAQNLSPGEYTDKIVSRFVSLWERLSISYDDFIRTTEKRHSDTVCRVLETLLKKKDIYAGKYEGFYCTPCETFWTEAQLKDKACPDCQRSVEKISEENYFFRMSRYQPWLIKYIKSHPEFILPVSRRNETLNFLQSPLADLCISRPLQRLSWGIPLPFSRGHVCYVWFDALINYISAPGFAGDRKKFKKLWPADIHIIGKDILRHHSVYWPIMLRALGLEPPAAIFAHGWWKMGGEKMSKSRGNIVDPEDIISTYGADVFRYFLLREVPLGLDGTYSEKALVGRLNSDLANDLGNLLHRSLTMMEKYFQGRIPESVKTDSFDKPLLAQTSGLPKKYFQAMDSYEFGVALDLIWRLINTANKYIEDVKPWKLAKEKQSLRLAGVVCNLLNVLRLTAILIYPFMPQTSPKMLQQLGLEIDLRQACFKDLLSGRGFPRATTVNKGEPLFPRIVT
jgi:methionyl-tRNA synthetase